MLKQFITELLYVDRCIPIFGRTPESNSSDMTSNHEMLTRISSIMAKHRLGPVTFVYMTDSVLVTENNLQAMDQPGSSSDCLRSLALVLNQSGKQLKLKK